MQNFIAAAILAASISATSIPAHSPGEFYPKTIQVRATMLTQAMAQRIHFNEGQYIRVKQLHLRYLTERSTLELELAGAPAAERDTQLAAAQQRYEQELENLLHPAQRLAYQQLRANFTAHRL